MAIDYSIFFDVRVTYLIVADRIDRIDRTQKSFGPKSRRDFLAFNLPLPAGAVAGNGKNQGCHHHNLGYNLCGQLNSLGYA